MAVLGVFLVVGSLNLEKIAAWQGGHVWWIVAFQPLAALLFLVSAYAEGSRLPFDLPEAEQELVGGFHTEYSSMKLGLLLMTEFIHLITAGFMMSILFLGGWALFGLENLITDPVGNAAVKAIILIGKMFLYCVFALVVRWTIPRFRFDQLMNLAWKVMIPLALANLVCVVFVLEFRWPLYTLTAASLVLFFLAAALSVRAAATITNPKRRVRQLPPGLPAGVTYAGR